MIGFVRGPGGIPRRLAGEIVPFAAGVAAGGTAIAFVPPAAAAAALVVAWIGASFAVRRLRARRWTRYAYRIALAAHVVFWSLQGLAAYEREAPGDWRADARRASAWSGEHEILAGYARVPFPIPDAVPLGGWGTRPRRLRWPPFGGFGVLGRLGREWMAGDEGETPRAPLFRGPDAAVAAQELGARAVVLREASGPPAALVRLDLVTSDADLTRAIAARVSDLGFRPEGLIVAATHTHSGPGAYSHQPFSQVAGTGHFHAPWSAALADAAARAVREAYASARPARVSLLRARDRGPSGDPVLARSRRIESEDRIDDRVYALRFDEADADRPIAVVLNYAVHPTLIRRRHLGFHRDLAGALEDALEARLPGNPPVLFVNGATADIAPRDKGLAVETRVEVLAGRFADAVSPALSAPARPPARRMRLGMASAERSLGTPHMVLCTGSRAAFLDAHAGLPASGGWGALGAKALALPVNAFLWSLGVPELHVGFRWDGSVGAVLNLEDMVPDRTLHAGAWTLELDDGPRVALLWSAGEGTQALGRAWREGAAAAGFGDALVVGLANGACGYVTTREEYRVDTYEARACLFGPEAGAIVTETLAWALEAAGGGWPPR